MAQANTSSALPNSSKKASASAMRLSIDSAVTPAGSKKMPPVATRNPTWRAARTVSAGYQNMSITEVTPERSSSAKPSTLPSREVSGFRIAPSAFQTVWSHGSSGRFSTSPRNRLSAAWQWVLTMPGMRMWPVPSTTRFARAVRGASCSALPSSTMRPFETATPPRSMIVPRASQVTTMALLMTRSVKAFSTSCRIALAPPGKRGEHDQRCEIGHHVGELLRHAEALHAKRQAVDNAEDQRDRKQRPGPAAREQHRDHGNPAATGAHVLHEQVDVGDRKLRAAQTAQRAAADERPELHALRIDAAGGERLWVLAGRAHAQTQPMAGEKQVHQRNNGNRDVEEDRLPAEDVADPRDGADDRDVDALETDDCRVGEGSGHVEHRAQQISSETRGQKVDGDRHHDRVAAAPQVELGEDEPHGNAADHGSQRARCGRAGEIGAQHCREGARKQEAFERDVADAGALAQRTAKRGEQDRRDDARDGCRERGVEQKVKHRYLRPSFGPTRRGGRPRRGWPRTGWSPPGRAARFPSARRQCVPCPRHPSGS